MTPLACPGGLVVLDGDKLSIIHETRDSNEWIRVACYSPDGQVGATNRV